MIRVTVQLIPKGIESKARTIATMEIANDATGTLDVGNYVGTLHAEYTSPCGRKGRVLHYQRRRQSVWSLVGAFLKLWGHTRHSPKHLSLFVKTETKSAITLPSEDQSSESPEGPGRDGNKPLMRNRNGQEEPSPTDSTDGNLF